MRKILLIITSGISLLTACSDKTQGPSAVIQQNLRTVDNIRKVMSSGQFAELDQYIAADAVDHDGDRGYVKGLDSIKMQMQAWHASAEEKTEVIRQLADENYVMSWENNKGKYLTDGQGHLKGDTFSVQMVSITKISDGKAVEHWMMMPPTDVMKMMASTAAPVVQGAKELKPDSIVKKKR